MAAYSGSSRATSQRWILVAACGATLALGVVIGIGAGRLGGQGHTIHPAVAAVTQAQPAIAQVQRAPQPAVATTQRSGASLYLVASEDEATVMRQAAETLGAPLGPRDGFVVVNADDDLAAVAQLVAAENALLAAASLAPITIRDLRPAQRSISTTASSSRVMIGQLPGCLNQATLLHLRIEEGQRAITRALAGDVVPNVSAAV